LWISSLTDKAIKEGLNQLKPGAEYDNLYEAARQRSESDWLVGMNASQALTTCASSGVFSLGRVQTPTLAMICRRYLENKNFVPSPYWQIELLTEKNGVEFKATTPARYNVREDAQLIYDRVLSEGTGIVKSVDKKTVTQNPPLLYDLTALQQEANKRYAFTADQTLSIAQKLYESKLISYPRTGSRYISVDVFEEIPSLISFAKGTKYGEYANYLDGKTLNKRCVNASKVTDHHALLPTGNKAELQGQEKQVYEMIVARMLEAFSDVCIKDITTVMLMSGNTAFEAKGEIVKQNGWRNVLGEIDDTPEEQGGKLPEVISDDILPITKVELLSKQTKPKPLFTEAALLAAMESAGKDLEDEEQRQAMKDSGLGTPATRAGIIETLLSRSYIVREKKNLIPTNIGLQVYEIVKEKQISDVSMTGKWEFALSKIEKGELSAVTFSEKIRDYAKQITAELLECEIKVDQVQQKVTYKCPKCGSNSLVLLRGVAKCSDENCGMVLFRKIAGKELTDNQMIGLIQKGHTPVIKGFVSSKSNKTFEAALKLDKNFKVVFEFPHTKLRK